MDGAASRRATALRLAKFFEVSPDFWMNLQLRWDLYHAQQTESNDLMVIQPVRLGCACSPRSRDRCHGYGTSARFAVMGGGSRFVGLVFGRGLTLVPGDGCAGWNYTGLTVV